jgi:hypothetical protein
MLFDELVINPISGMEFGNIFGSVENKYNTPTICVL